MNTQLPVWLQSSQDPSAVANKVKGAILLASSAIIFFAAVLLHITLSATDIVTLSTELGGVAGAIWTIYGFVLHIITWISTVKGHTTPVVVPVDSQDQPIQQ